MLIRLFYKKRPGDRTPGRHRIPVLLYATAWRGFLVPRRPEPFRCSAFQGFALPLLSVTALRFALPSLCCTSSCDAIPSLGLSTLGLFLAFPRCAFAALGFALHGFAIAIPRCATLLLGHAVPRFAMPLLGSAQLCLFFALLGLVPLCFCQAHYAIP